MSRSPSAARWSPERRWDGARRLSDVLVYRLFFDLSPVNSRQTVARMLFVDFAAVEQTSSKWQRFEGDLRRRRPALLLSLLLFALCKSLPSSHQTAFLLNTAGFSEAPPPFGSEIAPVYKLLTCLGDPPTPPRRTKSVQTYLECVTVR